MGAVDYSLLLLFMKSRRANAADERVARKDVERLVARIGERRAPSNVRVLPRDDR
jgi:hypothetical protein